MFDLEVGIVRTVAGRARLEREHNSLRLAILGSDLGVEEGLVHPRALPARESLFY